MPFNMLVTFVTQIQCIHPTDNNERLKIFYPTHIKFGWWLIVLVNYL